MAMRGFPPRNVTQEKSAGEQLKTPDRALANEVKRIEDSDGDAPSGPQVFAMSCYSDITRSVIMTCVRRLRGLCIVEVRFIVETDIGRNER